MVTVKTWQFVALAVIVAVLSSGVSAAWTLHAAERECQAMLVQRQ